MVEIERLWNILDSLFTFFSNFYQKMACFTTKLIPEFSLSCDNKFWVCSRFNSFKKSRSIDYFSSLSVSAIKFWVRSRQVCIWHLHYGYNLFVYCSIIVHKIEKWKKLRGLLLFPFPINFKFYNKKRRNIWKNCRYN